MICLPCQSSTCEHAAPQKTPHLTDREAQIVQLVGEGHPNKVIAFRLGLTEGTVKMGLCAIFRLLGASNRVQVARWAWEHPNLLSSGQESGAFPL